MDSSQPGMVRIDLSGIDAVRFKSVVGGDYPLGNEAQRRKAYGGGKKAALPASSRSSSRTSGHAWRQEVVREESTMRDLKLR
jgi:hypothetical protein